MFARTLRKAVLGLAAIAAMAAIVPAGASASTAIRNGSTGSTLYVQAAPGETNNMEVYARNGQVLVWERNNTDRLDGQPAGCQNYNGDQVWCPLSLVHRVVVDTGDMNDRLVAQIDAPITSAFSGGSGDDFLDVKGTYGAISQNPWTPVLLGGDGNDQLYGWQFSDSLYGGAGNDILGAGRGNDYLNGGTGVDRMDGGEDNDTLEARDGYRDFVACGTGTDKASIDKPKFEQLFTGCESLF